MTNRVYWLHTLTPLHVGSGRGATFIDLPIMREKSTDWPIVPGSAVKGVWRDHFQNSLKDKASLISVAFGKAEEQPETEQYAGSLVVTDARIVLLPIRSFYGTFAYATSPLALLRLKRDLEMAQVTAIPPIPSVQDSEALLCSESKLANSGKIYLDELDFEGKEDPNALKWANKLAGAVFSSDWQVTFKQRFVILPDASFDFFCKMGTEVNARIRIDNDKKIVKKGALWYEESLPVETVMAGLVWCDRVFGQEEKSATKPTTETILQTFCQSPLTSQFGGKASIGKGQVQCRFGA